MPTMYRGASSCMLTVHRVVGSNKITYVRVRQLKKKKKKCRACAICESTNHFSFPRFKNGLDRSCLENREKRRQYSSEGDAKTRLVLGGDIAFAFSFWQNVWPVIWTWRSPIPWVCKWSKRTDAAPRKKWKPTGSIKSKISARPSSFDTATGGPTYVTGTL